MHSMPCAVSFSRRPGLAEARNADDALVRRGALGQSRQRRADLAADAEDDEVAVEARASSATSSGVGVVITSSRCSTSRKRRAGERHAASRIWQGACAASITNWRQRQSPNSGWEESPDDSQPRIKTTVVGSYPFPDWLGALPSEQALIDATRVVIHTQEQAGIDLVCDGELYRFDVNHPETNGMIEYFVQADGGRAHRRHVRRAGRLSGAAGHGLPHASAGRGRRADRPRHARPAAGLRARAAADATGRSSSR